MDEIYAQAEREGWSNRKIEQVIRRCYQQEDKEIQSFLAAVEEAESRNVRLHGVRSNGKEYEGEVDSEDNDDDADESDSEAERVSNLVTTSCGQRNDIDLDDESSGSDSEEPPGRMLKYQRFSSNDFPRASDTLDKSLPQGMSDAE
ncbi:MAG: hypothetical protein Q9161_004249 [Pseudevernia consocians]